MGGRLDGRIGAAEIGAEGVEEATGIAACICGHACGELLLGAGPGGAESGGGAATGGGKGDAEGAGIVGVGDAADEFEIVEAADDLCCRGLSDVQAAGDLDLREAVGVGGQCVQDATLAVVEAMGLELVAERRFEEPCGVKHQVEEGSIGGRRGWFWHGGRGMGGRTENTTVL